jgi:hypothetical protein
MDRMLLREELGKGKSAFSIRGEDLRMRPGKKSYGVSVPAVRKVQLAREVVNLPLRGTMKIIKKSLLKTNEERRWREFQGMQLRHLFPFLQCLCSYNLPALRNSIH